MITRTDNKSSTADTAAPMTGSREAETDTRFCVKLSLSAVQLVFRLLHISTCDSDDQQIRGRRTEGAWGNSDFINTAVVSLVWIICLSKGEGGREIDRWLRIGDICFPKQVEGSSRILRCSGADDRETVAPGDHWPLRPHIKPSVRSNAGNAGPLQVH